MGLLKKLSKNKKSSVTVGKLLDPFIMIDKLKEQKLLQTTDTGIFYTYPQVLEVNKDPKNFLKRLYIYARTTGLLREGEVLQIREPEEQQLMATIHGDIITLFEIEKPKAEN